MGTYVVSLAMLPVRRGDSPVLLRLIPDMVLVMPMSSSSGSAEGPRV